MVNLPYVGPAADPTTSPGNVATRSAVTTAISAINPSKASVSTQISGLVGPTYATQTYIDTQDQSYVLPTYYQTKDLLNIPTTQAGANNGVATLDSGSKLPMNASPGVNQVPNLGTGYVRGPFGTTAVYNSDITTTTTKVKFAEWNLNVPLAGPVNFPFRPLVFMSCFASSQWGQPIIEVRITDSTTSPANYASAGTLVAQGLGRYLYNSYHAIDVVPVPDTTGQTPSNLDASYHAYLTAWIYDGTGLTTTMVTNKIANAAVFLLRGG